MPSRLSRCPIDTPVGPTPSRPSLNRSSIAADAARGKNRRPDGVTNSDVTATVRTPRLSPSLPASVRLPGIAGLSYLGAGGPLGVCGRFFGVSMASLDGSGCPYAHVDASVIVSESDV